MLDASSVVHDGHLLATMNARGRRRVSGVVRCRRCPITTMSYSSLTPPSLLWSLSALDQMRLDATGRDRRRIGDGTSSTNHLASLARGTLSVERRRMSDGREGMEFAGTVNRDQSIGPSFVQSRPEVSGGDGLAARKRHRAISPVVGRNYYISPNLKGSVPCHFDFHSR